MQYVTTWMNHEDTMLSEIGQSQNNKILNESTYMRYLKIVKFIESESKIVVGRRENGGVNNQRA